MLFVQYSIQRNLRLITLLGISTISAVMAVYAGNIRVKGSSTVLPIAQKTAEVFMKNHKEHSIVVEGGGSGVGIAALMDGIADIANISRKVKAKEFKKFEQKGIDAKVNAVGRDALSVIVNPRNPVKSLTMDQIEAIFTGKIENWKHVGGPDMAIVPISRESSSGTYEFFKTHVLSKKEYTSKCLASSSNGAMVQSVSQTEGAIGYCGLAFVNDQVHPLNIGEKEKSVEPGFKNAQAGTYPLVRDLNMVTAGEPKGLVREYLDFVFSAEGQAIVKEVGYIPVK
ncbi:MAG: PstS family phosphate ABC transporter substrate-binding protein [bacterium]